MRILKATVRAQPDTHSMEIQPIQHVSLWCVVVFWAENAIAVHNSTEDDQKGEATLSCC